MGRTMPAALVLRYVDPETGRARVRRLTGLLPIGRDPGPDGLLLDLPTLAKVHAVLDATPRGPGAAPEISCVAKDGLLFVNGFYRRMTTLKAGDLVRLGDMELQVDTADLGTSSGLPSSAPAPAPPRLRQPVSVPERPAPMPAQASKTAPEPWGVFGRRVAIGLAAVLVLATAPVLMRYLVASREKAEAREAAREKARNDANLALAAAAKALQEERLRNPAYVPVAPLVSNEPRPRSDSVSPLDYALTATVVLTGPAQNGGTVLGTGFFVSDQGHIITNAHVVKDMVFIEVQLNSNKKLPGRLVRADERLDLSMVKVDPWGAVPFLRFSTQPVHVGDRVYAIGTPIDTSLSFTVTSGIVSSPNRDAGDRKVLQHDAPINPGNSGGPLLNTEGNVVGVNTWGFMVVHGLGFAIPGSQVLEFIRGASP